MKKPNFYSYQGLDRLDRFRDDQDWFADVLQSNRTRLLPLWRNQHWVTALNQPISFPADEDPGLITQATECVLLGSDQSGTTWIALDISQLAQPEVAALQEETHDFRDLRTVGPLIDRQTGALLAHARAMMHWHRQHRYCGKCGSETTSARAGHLRVCSNPECGKLHHPRTDPAVIMLVQDGDYCLLGRQPSWPPGMHSTLAGFVEPGERLEDAVAREVDEEAGIAITDIEYYASQPWPFPSSIMLGFYATAVTTDIQVDGIELESAGWFHRDQLLNSPENEQFHLPRRDSISWRLIESWMHQS
ncbi:MAG: NAD(+) diphosphatase [Sedimenticola thiotaurini]|uniref:NAD(+) diphosphatase n=1 Tax=Sedimenticola thiotaurini TaxID=1543721 RepID=A0A558CTW2_9GAMM|nr:MAG: NAD(+) diphosphatase [Sedimenticola thiotaurini]